MLLAPSGAQDMQIFVCSSGPSLYKALNIHLSGLDLQAALSDLYQLPLFQLSLSSLSALFQLSLSHPSLISLSRSQHTVLDKLSLKYFGVLPERVTPEIKNNDVNVEH